MNLCHFFGRDFYFKKMIMMNFFLKIFGKYK